MNTKKIDIGSIIGILISVILAFVIPNIPEIPIRFILISVSFLIAFLILTIVYLNISKKITKIEEENKHLKEIKSEITSLKEEIENIKELSEIKSKVNILEKLIIKNGKKK